MSELHSWEIISHNMVINTIVSSEEFVSNYCDSNGYSYKRYSKDILNDSSKKIITSDIVEAYIKKENILIKAQLKAQIERSEFIEDCIAEMAGVVYNSDETT